MPDDKEQVKWYFKTSFLITAFLLVGPFALPLVWFNPRLSNNTKMVVTAIVAALTYFMGIALVNSINFISKYYQQINQMSF